MNLAGEAIVRRVACEIEIALGAESGIVAIG
jgi:hypothetical protein